MGQAGIQAGVPVEVRQETPTNLAFQVSQPVNSCKQTEGVQRFIFTDSGASNCSLDT